MEALQSYIQTFTAEVLSLQIAKYGLWIALEELRIFLLAFAIKMSVKTF